MWFNVFYEIFFRKGIMTSLDHYSLLVIICIFAIRTFRYNNHERVRLTIPYMPYKERFRAYKR
jgi:hypothetical protein